MNRKNQLYMKKKVIPKWHIASPKTSTSILKGLLLSALFLLQLGCSVDDTQTVVNFTNLTMNDEFDTDGAPNSSIWGYDIGNGPNNGWGNRSCNTIQTGRKM